MYEINSVVSTILFSFHFVIFLQWSMLVGSKLSIYDVIVVQKSSSQEGKFTFFGWDYSFHCTVGENFYFLSQHLWCHKECFICWEHAQLYKKDQKKFRTDQWRLLLQENTIFSIFKLKYISTSGSFISRLCKEISLCRI